jgi:hypothetical protein
MHRSLALVALLSASVLGAQETEPLAEPVVTPYAADDAVAIDPGMTREQVVARLGAPAAVRTSGTYTYLFFVNGCHRSCGTDDVVILEDGRVTDAIFRGLGRRYTGTSSSPVGVVPAATLGARAPRAAAAPRAFDAPAPSMVRPPEARLTEEPAPTPPVTPAAASRPALAAAEAVPAPAPATAPASERQAAPQPSRRAPVDAFRVVPIVRDSSSARARADTTSRP